MSDPLFSQGALPEFKIAKLWPARRNKVKGFFLTVSDVKAVFINQGLPLYYRKLHGLVKDFIDEGLIDTFWILNGTIKTR